MEAVGWLASVPVGADAAGVAADVVCEGPEGAMRGLGGAVADGGAGAAGAGDEGAALAAVSPGTS
ncbi:MAG: hypothetical protein K6U14_05270 [Firmicutes bacterium]|nr:hypothetical protein [Alicyclobacillaceae bacterium]MCL6497029.1 hypothetical protein [Bacillota bacterium]